MKNNPQILVAESDLISIYLMEKILSRNNFDFDLVCTPTEVKEMLEENHYDLLILSTIGCINEKTKIIDIISRIDEKEIPVLVLLTHQEKNMQIVGFENCDYLKKPFSTNEFIKKIRGLLKQKPGKTSRLSSQRSQN